MSGCKLLGEDLPRNRKGWYRVYKEGSFVYAYNWFCKDYHVQCELCRESSESSALERKDKNELGT